MDNKEILIVSQCKKDVTEIRKLNNEQENLNKICSDYEFDAEDAADNTSIIAILVGIIAIIVLIVIGVFWLLAIVLGCVIGFIVDLPFKLLRITFFKLRYVIKRSNITRRTKKIQKELSQISNSKEILYVKSIIGDNCYKEECLDFIMDEMARDSSKSIQQAYQAYVLYNREEARKKEEEQKRQKRQEREDQQRREEQKRRDEQRRYEEQQRREERRWQEEQQRREEQWRKYANNQNNNAQNSTNSAEPNYFAGCNDLETLIKRYKQLAKCYHPDTGMGDEATMKIINNQYEQLKKRYE